jgi:hypothetical protein
VNRIYKGVSMDKIRLVLAIIVAVVTGEFIDKLGLQFAGHEFSFKNLYIGLIFDFIAFFLVGFVSAFIAKQREILVSFIAFFIANAFWTYYEFQALTETTISFGSILIYILLPFLTRMAISLLGGFLAKKLNQLQKKKSADL